MSKQATAVTLLFSGGNHQNIYTYVLPLSTKRGSITA